MAPPLTARQANRRFNITRRTKRQAANRYYEFRGVMEGGSAVFSVTFRYAMISLMEMAHSEAGLRASIIANRHHLSGRYLANVLGELRRIGLVTSQKGRNGGYSLSRQPDQITLLEVYRGLAGSNWNIELATDSEVSDGPKLSSTDRWLGQFEKRWMDEMASTTLEDLDISSAEMDPRC